MISRLSFASGALLALFCLAFAPALPAEDPRIVVFLRSADSLTAELQHLCVDLARKPKEWEINVLPNIEFFLFGADRTRPIRYDKLIGNANGRREQTMVPIDNLNQFINLNLVLWGVVVTQDRRDKGLYSLAGAGFVGWMRVKDGYAVFADFNHLADIPPDMPAPGDSHSELLNEGCDLAFQLDNTQTTPEQRTAAFALLRDDTLAAIHRLPDETPEAFSLRTLNARHSLETMERLFVESSRVKIGLTLDSSRNVGTGRFVLSALPDTLLAETLQQQTQRPSRFASVADPDDAVLAARLNFTLSDAAIRQFAEFYKSTRLPLEQHIDNTEGLTDIQKQARKQISRILLDILTASLDLQRWDGLARITPHDSGHHTGLLSLSIKDAASVAKLLELLPATNSSVKTELNVDTAGDVAIHRMTVTANYPQALQDFFGPSGELFIGTGPDSLWLGIGNEALDAVHNAVAAAASTLPRNVDRSVAACDLHLLPILQLLTRLQNDCNFDLLAALMGSDVVPASILDDFEWRDIAIEALNGADDRLHFDLQHVNDRLEGDATVESGILKALGDVIAEFARQNLG